ncbi:MAG: DinB family protein [candidate division Zixibacteria bacterium]
MSEKSCLLKEEQIELWRKYIRPNINESLRLTPDDRLDWAPAEGMMTLGQVFVHIAETSDWWYDEVMKKNISVELTNKTIEDKKEVSTHLEAHWNRMERFFSEPREALEKLYSFTHKGKTFTFSGNWIFTHLLEHDSHHRSQIHQYLRILDITPPKV